MATHDLLEAQVISIISTTAKIPLETLSLETDLKAEHHIDSLLGLQVVATLENEFSIKIPDEELDCYTTVRSVVDTVRRLRSEPT